MPPTVLITRPQPMASFFADQLRARLGCSVPMLLSPVLQIENFGELPDLQDVSGLIFTSRNGVSAFVEKTGLRDIPCYCVGDATALDARKYGLNAESCAGSADDLVSQLVADKVRGSCLHIRGEHGVGDVSTRLTAAGIPTTQSVLYRQVPQALTREAKNLLLGNTPVVLPLFSPRTARILFSSASVTAPLAVLALSANVARNVPECHAKSVMIAARPDAEAMLNSIEVLIRSGKLLEAGNRAQ